MQVKGKSALRQASPDDLPDLDTSRRRSTRVGKKRKSDSVFAYEDEDEISPKSTPKAGPSLRNSGRQATKAKKSRSGIPFEEDGVKRASHAGTLAADASSSPPSSPRATRTSKKEYGIAAAKKMSVDDFLGELPRERTKLPLCTEDEGQEGYQRQGCQCESKWNPPLRKGRQTTQAVERRRRRRLRSSSSTTAPTQNWSASRKEGHSRRSFEERESSSQTTTAGRQRR